MSSAVRSGSQADFDYVEGYKSFGTAAKVCSAKVSDGDLFTFMVYWNSCGKSR